MPTPNLKAYRFSCEELEKMQWLKALFETNGYTFDPNRFPEVYYDTFDRAAKVFPEIKHMPKDDETADALAHYIPDYTDERCEDKCNLILSNEGVIVLYADKIEEYADHIAGIISEPKINVVSALRAVVLYHELGHWLTHWAKDKRGQNWSCGYYARTTPPDKHTHESLAQLIAYWCVNGHPFNDFILRNYLTPSNPTISPYRRYLKLTGISKVEVLCKLMVIRSNMACNGFFDDETASEFLALDVYKAIIEFADSKSLFKAKLQENKLRGLNLETILEVLVNGKIKINLDDNTIATYTFPTEYDISLCLSNNKLILNEQEKKVLMFNEKYCLAFNSKILSK